jgi:hypothetical protein
LAGLQSLPSHTVSLRIFILEKAHNNHWARYPKEDSTPVVAIEEFEKTAFELLHQVRETIYPAISI